MVWHEKNRWNDPIILKKKATNTKELRLWRFLLPKGRDEVEDLLFLLPRGNFLSILIQDYQRWQFLCLDPVLMHACLKKIFNSLARKKVFDFLKNLDTVSTFLMSKQSLLTTCCASSKACSEWSFVRTKGWQFFCVFEYNFSRNGNKCISP